MLSDGPKRCADTWERLGACPKVVGWLRGGVKPEFIGDPTPFHGGNTILVGDELEAWLKIRAKLLAQGAIEPATCTDYVCPSFMVPKKDSW